MKLNLKTIGQIVLEKSRRRRKDGFFILKRETSQILRGLAFFTSYEQKFIIENKKPKIKFD